MNTHRRFVGLTVSLSAGLWLAACTGEPLDQTGGITDVSPISFSHVTPVFVAGNPNCPGLGYDFGFKPSPEPPPNGTYTLTNAGGTLVGGAPQDPSNSVTITNSSPSFDWTSTLGIDAVIVKGGPNANVYVYDPPQEETSDDGLHSPINPNNSRPYAVSHIEFCYDYEVDVVKTAEAEFTRSYEWTITKTADQTDLMVSSGQAFTVNYEVTVENTGFTDSDWAVRGEIIINNSTPLDATIESVADVVSPLIVATVNCGVAFPHALLAGETLICAYSTSLPDGSNRTNTAMVETSGAVGGGEATADVVFGDPTTEIDECVDVNDVLLGGFLGTVCVGQAPKTFDQPYDIEFTDCGEFEVVNTATFTANDTQTEGSSSWTITVTVVGCGDQGCTLTPGYWKTHSSYGPVPEKKWDDTWDLIGGPGTPFFLSGLNYYEILWTSPRGDGYIILARAFIAAELNLLNGASMPADVQDVYDAALDFFETYDYAVRGPVKGKNKSELVEWYELLDDYNNGLVGPGHCDEDGS